MFEHIGRAAAMAGKGWALLIDEVQYLNDDELAAVIVAVHRMSQRSLPVMVFAGGLPQIAKLSGDAKSYSERLFIYPEIGALKPEAAREAIEKPLRSEGVEIEPAALAVILEKTAGYPLFSTRMGSSCLEYRLWFADHGRRCDGSKPEGTGAAGQRILQGPPGSLDQSRSRLCERDGELGGWQKGKRQAKRAAEDCAETCSGVKHGQNNLGVGDKSGAGSDQSWGSGGQNMGKARSKET